MTDVEREVRNYEALKDKVQALESECKAIAEEKKILEADSLSLRE